MRKFQKNIMGMAGVILTAFLAVGCSQQIQPVEGMSRSIASISSTITIPSTMDKASNFAVYGGGAGITNSGLNTQILGDAGTTGASTMITGFHSSSFKYTETPLNKGAISGTVYTAPPQGTVAEFEYVTEVAGEIQATFDDLASRLDGTDPGAGQLGGLTLAPGVYKSAAGSFLITGSDLTLDAQGDSDAVWIFQMASTLTVGTPTSPQSVILTNGAKAENVFWQVGSSATINGAGGGSMAGTIISRAGISFSTAGNEALTVLNGRALALFASVTMVNTVINATGTTFVAPVVPIDPIIPEVPVVETQIVVTGSNASSVVAVAGDGFLNIENNGGLVTVAENGLGTISIINNGGILTATNTGDGLVTISSDATGMVTVTNTGDGNVTVNATGAEAVTITHTGDEDYTYPVL